MNALPTGTSAVTHRKHEARKLSAAPGFGEQRLVWAVAILAFAHASVTVLWTLGGTLLLDTVGAPFDDLAREHSLVSFTFGTGVVLLKVTAALLALALLGAGTGRLRRRVLLIANGAAAGLRRPRSRDDSPQPSMADRAVGHGLDKSGSPDATTGPGQPGAGARTRVRACAPESAGRDSGA